MSVGLEQRRDYYRRPEVRLAHLKGISVTAARAMIQDGSAPGLAPLRDQCSTSRAQAIATGDGVYFTGLPCKRGHIAQRKTKTGHCIECTAAVYKAEVRAKDPHKLRRAKAEWRRRNPDKVSGESRRYREKHLEKVTARLDAWRKANPDQVRAHANNRRARKLAAGGSYTKADVAAIMKAQSGRCAYCKRKLEGIERHVDHIIPLAKGGSNHRRNLQILCRPCNQRKWAKAPEHFAREMGLLL